MYIGIVINCAGLWTRDRLIAVSMSFEMHLKPICFIFTYVFPTRKGSIYWHNTKKTEHTRTHKKMFKNIWKFSRLPSRDCTMWIGLKFSAATNNSCGCQRAQDICVVCLLMQPFGCHTNKWRIVTDYYESSFEHYTLMIMVSGHKKWGVLTAVFVQGHSS